MNYRKLLTTAALLATTSQIMSENEPEMVALDNSSAKYDQIQADKQRQMEQNRQPEHRGLLHRTVDTSEDVVRSSGRFVGDTARSATDWLFGH